MWLEIIIVALIGVFILAAMIMGAGDDNERTE